MYIWKPYIHERVRDPTCVRGSETEMENEYIRHPELGTGKVPWRLQKLIAEQ